LETTREYYEEIPVALPEGISPKIEYMERGDARVAGISQCIVKGLPIKRYMKQVKYTTLENLPNTVKFIEERNVVFKKFIWLLQDSPVKERPISVYFYGMPISDEAVFKKKVKNLF